MKKTDKVQSKSQISPIRALVWIFCLAFLAVGARNFETGLSLDAPIYASIAREMARTGAWFRMDSRIPDFVPFAEHPHLGFWVIAAFFKFLPAQDWAARVPGHLFYVGFLWMFFLFVRRQATQSVATFAIILLWSWHLFANVFSNVYLDPGALFFGAAAIFLFANRVTKNRAPLNHFYFAGALFGIGILYKGLTFLGWLPILAYLSFLLIRNQSREGVTGLLFFLVGVFSPVGVYLSAVANRFPEFFNIYWSRQVTQRFGREWSFFNLFSYEYWKEYLRNTYYLAPLALFSVRGNYLGIRTGLPVVATISFTGMFCLNGLTGGQYLIMIMPWLAWLISETICRHLPVHRVPWIPASATLAIVAVFILQYAPIRTHGRHPSDEQIAIRRLHDEDHFTSLILDAPATKSPYIRSGSFAWYCDLPIAYPVNGAIPEASDHAIYFLTDEMHARNPGLRAKGWCPEGKYSGGTLWISCRYFEQVVLSLPSGSHRVKKPNR